MSSTVLGQSVRRSGAHSLTTMVIHLLVAASVVHQLFSSLVMHVPFRGGSGGLLWQAHQAVGLSAIGVLTLFWLWMVVRRGETRWSRLFPWFTAAGWASLRGDAEEHLVSLRRLRLPTGHDRPLASATHGLGLLCASAVAVSGLGWFLAPGTLLRWLALNIHGTLGNAMWAYLIAHAGLALLHQLGGEAILQRMFGFLAPRAD
ncbi:MAG: cytochrome b/b6 domain-containing protein [Rhodospirillales bacterium]|nr:cytochrome b/b6 domain-containing protein [Rhodospirillales bacterium]MDE2576359.1 cytochrome b/b6 domain-containing protein [Rhodospirillales bacterium]